MTTLNVAPGEFESHIVDHPYFLGRTETNVRLALLELRRHDEWAPMASLCLYAKVNASTPEVCLQFVDQNRDGFIQARQYIQPQESKSPTISSLGKQYVAADHVRVSIREATEHTAFWVNGEFLFHFPGPPLWKRLEYSCSSAVCRFEFLR